MFFVIKKRHIVLVIFLIAIIVVSVFCATQIKTEYVYLVPKSEYLVVIDAGHGGIDVNIRHKVF